MTDRSNADPGTPDWELLARHLAGEATAGERAQVDAFLAANPADAEVLRALAAASSRIPAEVPAGLDVEGALARTRSRMRGPEVVPISRGRGSSRRYFAWGGLAAAAALLVFVVGRGFDRPSAPGAASEIVHRGVAGRVDSVRLADGSSAVLAPGAELVVPASYGKSERVVRLSGRAWFNAVHDDEAPLTVRIGDVVVRDIGTVFSIGPALNGGVRVAVHEGAVAVQGRAGAAAVRLDEGDETSITPAGELGTSRGTVDSTDADWVSGRLHFRDVSLEEFGRAVGEWTGVTVRLEDPGLGALRVTQELTFQAVRQRVEETALSVGAQVRWVGDTAVVSRSGVR